MSMETSLARFGDHPGGADDISTKSARSSGTILNSMRGDSNSDFDVALTFIKNTTEGKSAVRQNYIDEKKFVTKIDWEIVPIMFACYTMQFIDKVLINVSEVPKFPLKTHPLILQCLFSTLLLWAFQRISS
jgi:hypothetical protein